MTLIVAVKCKLEDGRPMIVFGADKQMSTQFLSLRGSKIRPLPYLIYGEENWGWRWTIGIAGDAYVSDEICRVINDWIQNNLPRESDAVIELRNNRLELGNIIFKVTSKYAERSKDNALPSVEIIIGACSDENESILFRYNSLGKSLAVNDYCIAGLGSVTGGELFFQQFYSTEMDDHLAVKLILNLISSVSSVDLSVGRGIDLYGCSQNTCLVIPKELYDSALVASSNQWNLLKIIYHNLNNSDFQNELKELMTKHGILE